MLTNSQIYNSIIDTYTKMEDYQMAEKIPFETILSEICTFTKVNTVVLKRVPVANYVIRGKRLQT